MSRIGLSAIIMGIITIFVNCSDDVVPNIVLCPRSPVISAENALNNFNFNTTPLNNSEFIVMSRNLYLGGDLTALLTGSDISSIFQGPGVIFQDIINSEFPRRAQGIAREIEQINPDIIALQEVVIIKTGDPDFINNSMPNADCTEYDFLEILMDALESKSLDYKVAVISENSDIELTDLSKDIRLLDSDVILVKSGLHTEEENIKIFDYNFSIDIPGLSLTVERSYSEVLVIINDNPIRIINTHLEVPLSIDSSINTAQGIELISHIINKLIPEGYPIILTGDFNSGPNSIALPYYSYNNILSIAHDSWVDTNPDDNGYTCCYSADLDDEPGALNFRIDHIFYLSSTSLSLTAVGSIITQLDNIEKIVKTDNSNIWSSDHAGIAAGFITSE